MAVVETDDNRKDEEPRKRRKRLARLAAHAVSRRLAGERHGRLVGKLLWDDGLFVRCRVNEVVCRDESDSGRLAIPELLVSRSWFLHCRVVGTAGEESVWIVRAWPELRKASPTEY